MNFSFKTLNEFNDFFKDEKTCYEFLESQIWNGVPTCPHCGTTKPPYKVKSRGKFMDIPSYRCSERPCDLPFTVRTKSIFEGSKVELRKWFQAIYEITTSKKGISSVELGTRIGVSQKTAWFINHRIRQMLIDTNPELLSGMVEADETFVGGKSKNKHKSKRDGGEGGTNMTIVIGLLQRGGDVRVKKVSDRSINTIDGFINKNVKPGETLSTDEWHGYNKVHKIYNHMVVSHSGGEYVNGNAHTNSLEGFWAQLKRGYVGIYHYMSAKHLQKYCDEFATRYNQRDQSNISRFLHVIKNSGTEKITYEELTSEGD